MNERDENLLYFIQEESELLLEMRDGCDLQAFLDSKMMQHDVSMALINIGESVKSLSEDLKEENSGIEWRFIAGLRDVAAHNYGILQMERIWDVVTEDVPELLDQVKNILLSGEGKKGK
ncbi:MAG: DUF86 domain-containing protein [Methanomicrobiales archaeon]|jgi:uncharacterized protein with HEPN domain|nr:DUF86 domain-containing protein [Methanomicrobiales archaeon]